MNNIETSVNYYARYVSSRSSIERDDARQSLLLQVHQVEQDHPQHIKHINTVLKNTANNMLTSHYRRVTRDAKYCQAEQARPVVDEFTRVDNDIFLDTLERLLRDPYRKTLQLLRQGYTTKEMQSELGIGRSSISRRMFHIIRTGKRLYHNQYTGIISIER